MVNFLWFNFLVAYALDVFTNCKQLEGTRPYIIPFYLKNIAGKTDN